MSVISSYDSGSVRPNYLVATKGAAEVVGQMLINKPENYDQQHQKLARKGIRVLALAYKELSGVDHPKLVAREKNRARFRVCRLRLCEHTFEKRQCFSFEDFEGCRSPFSHDHW